MPIIEDKTIQVSCRIPRQLLSDIKSMGRPGTIVTNTMNEFFKVKKNEATIEDGTTISGPDTSMIMTSHNKNQILLTVTKGDQVILLDYDEQTVCHLISKLNKLVNNR